DPQRLMHRMTRETGRQRLSFGVRLVAGEAGRFESMGRVTGHAGDLGMLARVFRELVTDAAVAVETGVGQLYRRCDLLGSVRIGMACGAVGDAGSMWRLMAGRTLGHDRIPVPLARAIGVKDIVTVLAGETMP